MPGSLWRLLKKLKAYFKKKERHCYLSLDFTQSPFILQLQYLPSYSFSPLPLRLQHLVLFQQFSSKGISCRLCLAALSVTGKEGCAAPPASQPTLFSYPTFAPVCLPLQITPPGMSFTTLPSAPTQQESLHSGKCTTRSIRLEESCRVDDGRAVTVAVMPRSDYRSLLLARRSYQSEGLSLVRARQAVTQRAHLLILLLLVSRVPRYLLLPG